MSDNIELLDSGAQELEHHDQNEYQ